MWQEEGKGEKKAFITIFSSLELQHSPGFLVTVPEGHLQALKPGWFLSSHYRNLLDSPTCGPVNDINTSTNHLSTLSQPVSCLCLYLKWFLITKSSVCLCFPGEHGCHDLLEPISTREKILIPSWKGKQHEVRLFGSEYRNMWANFNDWNGRGWCWRVPFVLKCVHRTQLWGWAQVTARGQNECEELLHP